MTSTVSSVSSGTSASTSGGASSSGVGDLTMSDFLTLMTAQLKSQDPLNPTDSNQFLSQLSELSTVQGITQLNTSMSTLSNSMLSSQALQSASLVGKDVLTAGSSAAYTSGSTLSGAVQVPSGASSVLLTITNAAGSTVDQMQLSNTAGLQDFSWNGQTSSGATAPSGTYSVSATANVGGTTSAATTYLNGTVSSISLDSTGTSVTLNTPQLGAVALGNVTQFD